MLFQCHWKSLFDTVGSKSNHSSRQSSARAGCCCNFNYMYDSNHSERMVSLAIPFISLSGVWRCIWHEDRAEMLLTLRSGRRQLSTADKKSYLAAVQCILTLPPLTSKAVAPGATCRYDDFIAAHSIHMMSIHFVVKTRSAKSLYV